jgi:hypothetical protein
MEWIVPFVMIYKRIDQFHDLWTNMFCYPEFVPFDKPNTAWSQWNGKERKELHQMMV